MACHFSILALDWTRSTYPCHDAHVVAPLVTGIGLVLLFGLYGKLLSTIYVDRLTGRAGWKCRSDGIVAHVGTLTLHHGRNADPGIGSRLHRNGFYLCLVRTSRRAVRLCQLSSTLFSTAGSTRRLPVTWAKQPQAGIPAGSVHESLEAVGAGESFDKVPGINGTILKQALNARNWACAKTYRLAWASIIPFVVLAIVAVYFIKQVKGLMT